MCCSHWSHLDSDEPSERKTGMERLGSSGEINPALEEPGIVQWIQWMFTFKQSERNEV